MTIIWPSKEDHAGHSEGDQKTGTTADEVGRQHQRVDRHGLRQFSEGGGGQREMEQCCCQIIVAAPTTSLGYGISTKYEVLPII